MTSITVGTEDLRLALRAVAPHADPDPEFPQLHRIRLSVGSENVTVSATNRYTIGHTVTDVSGLFPGKSLRLPKYPIEDNFPNVAALIKQTLTRQAESTDRLITNGRLLGLFGKAAAAYGEQLVLDTSGGNAAILITCGESFVGALMPVKGDDEAHAKIEGWHADWLERLADLAPVPRSA